MTGLQETNLTQLSMPQKAVQALRLELDLTPKPGLVDRHNQGAHTDMDYALFRHSINTIAPWLSVFVSLGETSAYQPADQQLQILRPAGIACEQAMFSATRQVNTHKGGIFSLGILCCVAGRLKGQQQQMTLQTLCQETRAVCQGLVERELSSKNQVNSAGGRIYQQFSLTGARGEAESGFMTVRRHVLPYWYVEPPERRLHSALLRLMAVNHDTNLVSRGGMEGLLFVQKYAQRLLTRGWNTEDLQEMDRQLIARHLSPGGSADLLAIATVLASFMPADFCATHLQKARTLSHTLCTSTHYSVPSLSVNLP